MDEHRASSSKRVHPWHCQSVQFKTKLVDSVTWQEILETVARELYSLSHQLQDNRPVSIGDIPRSYSSLRLVQTKSSVINAGKSVQTEKGIGDGELYKKAS